MCEREREREKYCCDCNHLVLSNGLLLGHIHKLRDAIKKKQGHHLHSLFAIPPGYVLNLPRAPDACMHNVQYKYLIFILEAASQHQIELIDVVNHIKYNGCACREY